MPEHSVALKVVSHLVEPILFALSADAVENLEGGEFTCGLACRKQDQMSVRPRSMDTTRQGSFSSRQLEILHRTCRT